jgi:hypothetical protein
MKNTFVNMTNFRCNLGDEADDPIFVILTKQRFSGYSDIQDKPVGDWDHEVLGMGSFGENTQLYTGIK